MGHSIYLVDVFAQEKYAGNPLAVVVGDSMLPDETMQKIASEINYSETTFVLKNADPEEGCQLRIFTPSREIAFAGHPILGTAWVIAHYVREMPVDSLCLHLKVGKVQVVFERTGNSDEIVWFDSPVVSFERTCDALEIARALGIGQEDIDTDFPIQEMSAGTSAIIVPLKTLDGLRRSRLDLPAYEKLLRQGFPPLVYLFCRQTRSQDNDLSARFFFEANGIREDPATGNGAAFLGAYLQHYEYMPETNFQVRVEQGYEVHRPSLVFVNARVLDGKCQVRVGGRVIPVMQGDLL